MLASRSLACLAPLVPLRRMSLAAPRVAGRSFRLALIQMGGTTDDTASNLAHARALIAKAAQGDAQGKPDLVVLPVGPPVRGQWLIDQEIFNSPYAAPSFPKYAEEIGFVLGTPYDVEKSASGSIKMLSRAAQEAGVWLVGGPFLDMLSLRELRLDRFDSRASGRQNLQFVPRLLAGGSPRRAASQGASIRHLHPRWCHIPRERDAYGR